MRILIADDHPVVRQGLRDLIREHAGWEVCAEASNGMEALELARRLGPDVAILDLTMPLLNGLETARKIRSASPGVEILLFTVHDSEQLAEEAAEAGARAFVLKSQPVSALIAAIEAAAARRAEAASDPASETRRADGRRRHPLSPRQREIVQLIAEGKSNKEMASMLGVSVRTIETHRAHIMQQLGARSAVQIVRYAVRNHMVDP